MKRSFESLSSKSEQTPAPAESLLVGLLPEMRRVIYDFLDWRAAARLSCASRFLYLDLNATQSGRLHLPLAWRTYVNRCSHVNAVTHRRFAKFFDMLYHARFFRQLNQSEERIGFYIAVNLRSMHDDPFELTVLSNDYAPGVRVTIDVAIIDTQPTASQSLADDLARLKHAAKRKWLTDYYHDQGLKEVSTDLERDLKDTITRVGENATRLGSSYCKLEHAYNYRSQKGCDHVFEFAQLYKESLTLMAERDALEAQKKAFLLDHVTRCEEAKLTSIPGIRKTRLISAFSKRLGI